MKSEVFRRTRSCLLSVVVLAGLAGTASAADPILAALETRSDATDVALRQARASSDPSRRFAGVPARGAEPTPPPSEWIPALGAQIRLRGDVTRNQSLRDFGFTPGAGESQLLERSRVHVSIEKPALGVRVFAEGQSYGRWGGIERTSDVDPYQAYAEWRGMPGLPIALKAGRQELTYGSAFFLGANDFYNGLSWDGIKASASPVGDLDVDLIASRMAKLNPGDPDIYLTGAYAAYVGIEKTSIEGYFFHHRGGFPFFHREIELQDSGQRWFTVGLRAAGGVGRLSYEVEPEFQWGRVKSAMGDGEDTVRAYGGHVDAGYTLDCAWAPRVFAAYAFGSGHDDIRHGTYGEFHGNLFNDNYLVGDTSLVPDLSGITVGGVHASGMHVAVAGVAASPFHGLDLNLDVHRFLAAKSPSGFSGDVGTEVNFVASYKPTPWLSVLFGVNRFFTGEFFRQASRSAKDVEYAYLQMQVEL